MEGSPLWEGNVWCFCCFFNDALNTFNFWLYSFGDMKDHSNSGKRYHYHYGPLVYAVYIHYPTNRIAHTMAFITLVVGPP